MKILKYIFYIIVLGVCYLFALINFGTSETKLACIGSWTNNGVEGKRDVVNLKLAKYSWFVFYADSYGDLTAEFAGGYQVYRPELELLGNIIAFDRQGGDRDGRYSTLSRQLYLPVPGFGIFKGQC